MNIEPDTLSGTLEGPPERLLTQAEIDAFCPPRRAHLSSNQKSKLGVRRVQDKRRKRNQLSQAGRTKARKVRARQRKETA